MDNDKRFHEYFRLTKYQFHYILSLIEKDITVHATRTVKKPISPLEKFAVTLRLVEVRQVGLSK